MKGCTFIHAHNFSLSTFFQTNNNLNQEPKSPPPPPPQHRRNMFRSRHNVSMDKNHKLEFIPSEDHAAEPPPDSAAPMPEEEKKEEEQEEEEVVQEPHCGGVEHSNEMENEIENLSLSADHMDNNLLLKLSEEVDQFISMFSSSSEERVIPPPPEIPDAVEKFAQLIQVEIVKCVSGHVSSTLFDDEEQLSILDSIEKISKLTNLLVEFHSEKDIVNLVNLTSTVLQRAMSFLEEEFRTILDAPRIDSTREIKSKRSGSSSFSDPDRCVLPSSENNVVSEDENNNNFPGYSMETVLNLKKIAAVMILSGYVTECCQVYSMVRRIAFEDGLSRIGFEKISIDDVQKMSWEALEGEIVTWIKVFKQSVNVYFPGERKLCEQVFSEIPSVSDSIFNNLTRNILLQLLNFAQAVAMTKRSAEKLFKFLDMYETLRDLIPTMDELFSDQELRAETQSARCHLGESAVAIFCDLENSIKNDVGKIPVPGGAVHPLTRYTINYVKYACEYKDTLEQVFQENKSDDVAEAGEYEASADTAGHNDRNDQTDVPSPFSEQLMAVMDLLDSNIESKSKLYKDLSLSSVFLMNNGRYIMQKIKESTDIYQLLGNTWSRKRYTDLRQYHKNYQRETWIPVVEVLREEGLKVNGKVLKPVLKERFKSFNAMFEEIHKTQSTWIVSDNQLQSELRVSISAIVVPAYRSFLARYGAALDSGRQSDKYIKYQPDDIEGCIEKLFEGNQSFMMRKKT